MTNNEEHHRTHTHTQTCTGTESIARDRKAELLVSKPSVSPCLPSVGLCGKVGVNFCSSA